MQYLLFTLSLFSRILALFTMANPSDINFIIQVKSKTQHVIHVTFRSPKDFFKKPEFFRYCRWKNVALISTLIKCIFVSKAWFAYILWFLTKYHSVQKLQNVSVLRDKSNEIFSIAETTLIESLLRNTFF